MSLETQLRKETEKWTKRINKEIKAIRLKDKSKERMLENVNAYIKDSGHFMEKGDLIRSFEAIVWAWAWLEILKELEVLE